MSYEDEFVSKVMDILDDASYAKEPDNFVITEKILDATEVLLRNRAAKRRELYWAARKDRES